ncbi:hypothetical protein ABZ234_03950 [Nocardiopsis sp. NPDC006198]|uniref:hypothetical protein n=1 Tax=Nocardiopsis sp. NPDC006198 TaxID=3154472 RepID=UPI0033A95B55
MAVISFADSSLGGYFAARRRLIASGLRGGYPLGNTLCCRYCDTEIDPATRACACWQPKVRKATPTAAEADTPEKAKAFFESIGIKVSETVTVIN